MDLWSSEKAALDLKIVDYEFPSLLRVVDDLVLSYIRFEQYLVGLDIKPVF